MHKGILRRFALLFLKIFRKVSIYTLLSSVGVICSIAHAYDGTSSFEGSGSMVPREGNAIGDVPTADHQGLKSFDTSKIMSLLKVNEFNRMPPVLDNRPRKNILISKAGVQVLEEDETTASNPVSSMPYFSSNIEDITVFRGPLIISSRGTEFDNTHSAQVRAQSGEVSEIFQKGLDDDIILKRNFSPSQVFYFGNGSTKLTKNVRKSLIKLVNLYNENGGGLLRVVGHASQRTRDMSYTDHVKANFELSLARARVVSEFLVKRGVPSVAIIVEAKGSRYPEYLEMMPAGEAKNRRVEVYLE